MWRCMLAAAVLFCMAPAGAQETREKSAAEKLRDNPNDAQALNALVGERLREVAGLIQSDPETALAKLKEFEQLTAGLQPDAAAAKALVSRIGATINALRDQIEAAKIPLAELEAKLLANPHDKALMQKYWTKVLMTIPPKARTEPDAAAADIEGVRATLAKVTAGATDEESKRLVETMERTLKSLDNIVESGQKLAALIGKDAAPLGVEAWVNGTPLTDDDLKGKVVLLDFWAVWCGPCIATFPHLREWHEKYAEKGLVIIGLTRYYEYDWIAAENRASKVPGTSHDAEQAMLVKFAEHHGLKHRFGIEGENDSSEFYGVTGIPHVVVIDRQGKIRMMRVGSGEKNAQEIGDLLGQLIEAK